MSKSNEHISTFSLLIRSSTSPDVTFSKRRSAFDKPQRDHGISQRNGEMVESLGVGVRQRDGEHAQILILDKIGEQLGQTNERGEKLQHRNGHG